MQSLAEPAAGLIRGQGRAWVQAGAGRGGVSGGGGRGGGRAPPRSQNPGGASSGLQKQADPSRPDSVGARGGGCGRGDRRVAGVGPEALC